MQKTCQLIVNVGQEAKKFNPPAGIEKPGGDLNDAYENK